MIGETLHQPDDEPGQAPDATPDMQPSEPQDGRKPPAPPGREIGGRDGPDPTRYGDWEKNGRCIDF